MGDTPDRDGRPTATRPFIALGGSVRRPRLPERWQVTRMLGRGGQAEVWLAHDARVGEPAAVKVFREDLSPVALERLRREVRLGRSLRHPHLVQVYELIEAGDRLAIAMQWMPGGSLSQLLCEGPLPVADVLAVAEQMLEVLAYLHAANIVHRDVKPSNILVDETGGFRLGDLGLVRIVEEEAGLTHTGTAVGTPAYMSPEQLRSDLLTGASDLYSLGATLFHLLTGRQVFSGSTDFEVANRHIAAPAPNPRSFRRDCPRWFAAFLLRLLEKHPADRWPEAGPALRAFRLRRGLISPRRRRWFAVAAAVPVALVVLGVLAGPRMLPRFRPPAATVAVQDRMVRGLDSRGTVLWKHAAATPIRRMERGDFTGDGLLDVAVAAWPDASPELRRDEQPTPAEVLLISSRGRLLNRFRPEGAVQRYWGGREPPTLHLHLTAKDLDGDGVQELILNTRHRALGSSYLYLYWPTHDRWEALLLSAGYIVQVHPLPDPERPRLQVVAYNSPVAALHLAMELELVAPGYPRRPTSDVPGSRIDGLHPLGSGQLRWVTPVGSFTPGNVGLAPTPGGDGEAGSWTVLTPDGSWTADRRGNPVPGPNAGRDLASARVEFLRRVRMVEQRAYRDSGSAVADERKALENRFADLLREPFYPEILVLYESRALALAGHPLAAAELLADPWRRSGLDSLGYHRANFLAVAGELEDAAAVLRRTIDRSSTPSGDFLSMRLLAHVAVELRDEVRLREANSFLAGSFAKFHRLTHEARARLWWDRPTPADAELFSTDLTPDGAALACLARWRLGLTRPGDVEAMATFAAGNPDAYGDALVAAAAAELGLGRAAAALARLDAILPGLEWDGRQDLRRLQYHQLARALQVRALVEVGRRGEADEFAADLRRDLRPGLLPAIVVDEALEPLR